MRCRTVDKDRGEKEKRDGYGKVNGRSMEAEIGEKIGPPGFLLTVRTVNHFSPVSTRAWYDPIEPYQ